VRQFTEQKEAPLVDLTAEFIEMRTESLYVDDLHPNSLGNEIIAHAIFAKMQEQ
jgi:lysophospholipase L1-like esterase